MKNIKLRAGLITKQVILLSLVAVFIGTPAVQARGYEDLSVGEQERLGIYFAKGDFTCGANNATATETGTGAANSALNLTGKQVQIAQTIIGVAKTYNLGKKGATVALIVALAESHLRIYASTVVPESRTNPVWKALTGPDKALGHDNMSVGVYQQQVTTGWSTYGNYGDGHSSKQAIAWQLMDPTYSVQAFLGLPKGASVPSDLQNPSALRKGLQSVSGWENLDPWDAAQKVQISAYDGRPRAANNNSSVYGGNYKAQMTAANQILAKYYDSSPAVPVIIKTGTGSGTADGTQNGNDTASLNNNCPEDGGIGSSAVDGALFKTIVKYAWPTYHPAVYLNKKPEYQAAIKAAQKRGEYVGGGQYPGVDCGGFVTRVFRDSGVDPKYNAYQSNVVSQRKYLRDNKDKYQELHVSSISQLHPGDIFINADASHTYIYVGKIDGFKGNAASASFSTTGESWRAPMASNTYDFKSASWFRPIALKDVTTN